MLRLLGSVEVSAGPGRSITGSPRQRLLLAALAADAGRTVPLETLVDRVWGADPPPQVRRTIHSYIARIRRMVEQMPAGPAGPVRVVNMAGGYRLELPPERVDLHRFRSLVGRARTTPIAERRAVLSEAVGLWRGDALIGLDGPWVQRVRQSWQHERVAAVVAWAEAELAAGDPAAVAGPLTDLAAEFPLDEPLAAVRMRVLAACGFKAKALESYRATRGRLAEELGVDAGLELQAVHRALVRGELDPRPPTTEPAPAQLPPGPATFAGREKPLATLAALAGSGGLAVLCGPAGIGKTALALQAAHLAATLFPDGQLYLDLHGGETGRGLSWPVRYLLDGLNVPASRVPAAPDLQTALYRSRTAGLRLLIILDNARDAAQVRPLLPGSPGCLVLVTCRDELVGLVADGATPITLGPLTERAARQLLRSRLSAERLAAEPEAVRDLIEQCGGRPAELATVAARAAIHPERRLATLLQAPALTAAA